MHAFISTTPLIHAPTHNCRHVCHIRHLARPSSSSSSSCPKRSRLTMHLPSEPSEQTNLLPNDTNDVQINIQPSPPLSSTPPPPPHSQMPGLASTTAPLDARVIFAEFLCTFLFIYLSVSAQPQPALARTLSNACIITALAASFMPVSGAHLNPAVTLSLLATDRVSLPRALAFVIVQLLASLSACVLASLLGVAVEFGGVSGDMRHVLGAFCAEFIPMFIIVLVVFQTAVASEREGGVGAKLAAVYIGLAVLACAGTFAGVFNPALAFGRAVVGRALDGHWVYWVGPMLGAVSAAFISEHVFLAPASGRSAQGWLAQLLRAGSDAGKTLKNLGVAGLISYGIMNTLFYCSTFSVVLLRVGVHSGASGVAHAWLVTWSLSQLTKPLRLAASVALAPFVDRFLKRRTRAQK